MSKIKNGGLNQYGAERFKKQQFETAGIEGVNRRTQLLDFDFAKHSVMQTVKLLMTKPGDCRSYVDIASR